MGSGILPSGLQNHEPRFGCVRSNTDRLALLLKAWKDPSPVIDREVEVGLQSILSGSVRLQEKKP